MGTGEPFDNYDNVMEFIDIVNNDFGLGLGSRHISVSTVGLVPKIKEFAHKQSQVNLAISLHCLDNAKRDELMPINRVYPVEEIIDALHYYQEYSNRKITIEYIMIDEYNDTDEDLKLLMSTFRKFKLVHINLIPYNEVLENGFKRSKRVNYFSKVLKDNRFNVTVRKEFGRDILGSCGQLRAKVKG
jgi:23S rRNA (adenine2503-C2)-methyltransferase